MSFPFIFCPLSYSPTVFSLTVRRQCRSPPRRLALRSPLKIVSGLVSFPACVPFLRHCFFFFKEDSPRCFKMGSFAPSLLLCGCPCRVQVFAPIALHDVHWRLLFRRLYVANVSIRNIEFWHDHGGPPSSSKVRQTSYWAFFSRSPPIALLKTSPLLLSGV